MVLRAVRAVKAAMDRRGLRRALAEPIVRMGDLGVMAAVQETEAGEATPQE